ncbi:MAG: PspC domain-containing protein [Candidatus Aminicenantes bacterium]|nr:PspC domain-containing protein [Candidatus Aminicenantes bacterium]
MKRLYRSRKDRKIGGICGGLGEYFNIDPNLVRLAMVFLALITAVVPFILAYVIAWIIIPLEPAEEVKKSEG